jgi:hypothetical protein
MAEGGIDVEGLNRHDFALKRRKADAGWREEMLMRVEEYEDM